MTARLINTSSLSNVTMEVPSIMVEDHAIRLDRITTIAVYRADGKMVYSGKTNYVDNLVSGLYVVRIGSNSRKIIIK